MNEVQSQLEAPAPSGFELDVTPKQQRAGESSTASAIGKVIMAIVIIGAGIVALPFVFCGLLLIVGSIAGPLGFVAGPIGVVVVIWLAIFLLRKLFKKK
jgi:hypothetical protein